MGAVSSFIGDFLNNIYRPNVEFSDIAEILIIAFFLYHIILWMKTSRAWTLLKGILVIIQRLPAAHEHNIAHLFPGRGLAQMPVGAQHLAQHFPAGQVAHTAV